MAELCAGLEQGDLLAVSRELSDAGLRESFHVLDNSAASMAQIVPHLPPGAG